MSSRNEPLHVVNLTKEDDENQTASGSAEKSLRLLSLLAEEGRPMTLAELTTQLDWPKVTVHRLSTNMLAVGYLTRDIDERYFTIGPALRRLAFNALNNASLQGMRHVVLKNLAREIGETCNLTTLDGAEVLYLDRVEAKRPLRLTIDVGSHVPLHASASGKLLLAYQPKAKRDTMIRKLVMTKITPQTITSAQELKLECDEILRLGYAKDNEELVSGLIAIAVPVRDDENIVRATVSVHAPTARMSMQQAEQNVGLLMSAAAAMRKLI